MQFFCLERYILSDGGDIHRVTGTQISGATLHHPSQADSTGEVLCVIEKAVQPESMKAATNVHSPRMRAYLAKAELYSFVVCSAGTAGGTYHGRLKGAREISIGQEKRSFCSKGSHFQSFGRSFWNNEMVEIRFQNPAYTSAFRLCHFIVIFAYYLMAKSPRHT